jgi:NTP pyrophosphatase (non-canonical NTP hydrolase)
MRPDEALKQIETEYHRANDLYSDLHSNHEAYAVIKEEMDELWDEIKKNKGTKGNNQIRHELIQIGAMVVRYLDNLC